MKKLITFNVYKIITILILLFLTIFIHPVFGFLFLGFPIFSIGLKLSKANNAFIKVVGKVIKTIGFSIFSFPILLCAFGLLAFVVLSLIAMIIEPLKDAFEIIKLIFSLLGGLFGLYVVISAFSDTLADFVNCKLCGTSFPRPKRLSGSPSKADSFVCSSCK